MSAAGPAVLEVSDLHVGFGAREDLVEVVSGVSFAVRAGSILGIVGESGSGKSMTALSILGLVEPPGRVAGGQIRLHGRDLLTLGARELNRLRGDRIAMVFQDPTSSLNPVLRIETQMIEAIRAHRRTSGRADAGAQGKPAPRAGSASFQRPESG